MGIKWLLQDPDQVQADPSPLRVHIQDPNLHPFPRSQGQATAALADRQFVQGDVALVDEARAADTDIYKSPEQSCVVHPASQHRTHPQITHRHNAPLKVRLPKIWGWQKEREYQKDEVARWKWGREMDDKIRYGWQLAQMFGRRETGKGDAGKWRVGQKWQTDITFRAATQYLCLHTSTFLSILFYPTFHLACSWEIFFLSVALTQTRKARAPGNSPVQLSSPQHWFHAVASAHLFTQLSTG